MAINPLNINGSPATYLTDEGKWESSDGLLYSNKGSTQAMARPEDQGSALKTIGQIGVAVAQSIPRNIASTLLKPVGVDTFTPETKTQKILLGSQPILRPKQEGAKTLQAFGVPGETASKFGLPAFALGAVLDYTGFGGKQGIEQALLKTKTYEEAFSLLKKAGVADDLAKTYAPKFAQTTNLNEIKQGVNALENLAKTSNTGGKVERGFVSSVKEEFPEMKVAGQYIPRDTDRLAIKAKNLVKDDIATAERIALTQTDDDAVATGAELIKYYGDQAAKAVDDASKSALYERGAEVANVMARNLTEQGRAVQAASILGRLTPEGQIRFAAKEIQRYNENIDKIRGGIFGLRKKVPELSGKQADYILTEMKAIESMADGVHKAMRFQKLQNYVSDLVPSSFYKKMVTLWKAGLLTGLKTSGLNIFSNLSHGILETAKDIPASFVDSVASIFTGKRTLAFTARKYSGGVKEGFGKGWQHFRTGFDERDIGNKLDYTRVNFGTSKIARVAQWYETRVFRIIGAEDQPFYYGAKARSLADQALAQAKNAGLSGTERAKFVDNLLQNPTDDMIKNSVFDAETAVFQNKTRLGSFAKKLKELPLGEVIVPFAQTPSAVAMQILNYSPVGIVSAIAENIGKGRFNQRQFAQAMGRGLTGTAALYLGGELFKKGLITLNRPTNEREKELWAAEGRIPNSIKINGKWRSVQVLGPAGNLLLVGSHFQNAFENSGSPTEAMSTATFGSLKSFTEQTFLKGMSQVVEAINDPARSGEGYLGNLIASGVPTLISDIARGTDQSERRTEGFLGPVQGRIPGLRDNLQPQVDVLGRERKRAGSFLETMIDPTRPSNEVSTPVVLELRRLTDAGFKISPTKLGEKEGYEVLTSQENTDLWKRAGEITADKLGKLFRDERYVELSDEEKGKIIEDFVEKSKIVARAEKVLQLTEGLEGEDLLAKLKELKHGNGSLMTEAVFNLFMQLR